MKHEKPLFLLLLGVEGSGHHMLMAFLKHFFKTQNVEQHGAWHPYLSKRWDALKLDPVKTKDDQELKSQIARIMDEYSPRMKLMFSGVSFPYGRERDTLRRPDIIDMIELLEPYVEFRPLVIYRDPVSCTYSALRRGFNNNALHQARFVEDNLIFIKQQLQACGLDYRTLSYERFVADLSVYEVGFKQWWGLNNESFIAGKNEIRPATAKKEIPADTSKQLDAFFSPMRTKQWDGFLEKNDIAERVK